MFQQTYIDHTFLTNNEKIDYLIGNEANLKVEIDIK